jgi:hypothetical protein
MKTTKIITKIFKYLAFEPLVWICLFLILILSFYTITGKSINEVTILPNSFLRLFNFITFMLLIITIYISFIWFIYSIITLFIKSLRIKWKYYFIFYASTLVIYILLYADEGKLNLMKNFFG